MIYGPATERIMHLMWGYKTSMLVKSFQFALLSWLVSDCIGQNDLQEADAMLQDFVLLMATLFDTTKCTTNIHILQHLASYATRRGPLWAYSCFAFENMNAFMKPLVHGTHHAKEQIGCALGLFHGLMDFVR